MKRWLGWAAMVVAIASAVVLAPHHHARPAVADRERSLAAGLRCPTCAGESALESQAPISVAIRAEIARQVDAGRSDAAIDSYFVGRYGPSILLRPPTRGVGVLVWVAPVLGLLAGAGVVARILVRTRKAPARVPTPAEREAVGAARATTPQIPARGVDLDRLGALEAERAHLLRALGTLDAERAAGDIDERAHGGLADDLTVRAAAVLAEIEAVHADLGAARAAQRRHRPRRMGVMVGMATAAVVAVAVGAVAGATHSSSRASAHAGLAARLGAAKSAAQAGRSSEALADYNAILAADPRQTEALSYRGLLLAIDGQTAVGQASIERAITIDPGYPDAHFMRGLLLDQQGDAATATAEFHAALADSPPPELAAAVRDALATVGAPAPTAPGGLTPKAPTRLP